MEPPLATTIIEISSDKDMPPAQPVQKMTIGDQSQSSPSLVPTFHGNLTLAKLLPLMSTPCLVIGLLALELQMGKKLLSLNVHKGPLLWTSEAMTKAA